MATATKIGPTGQESLANVQWDRRPNNFGKKEKRSIMNMHDNFQAVSPVQFCGAVLLVYIGLFTAYLTVSPVVHITLLHLFSDTEVF